MCQVSLLGHYFYVDLRISLKALELVTYCFELNLERTLCNWHDRVIMQLYLLPIKRAETITTFFSRIPPFPTPSLFISSTTNLLC